MNENQRLSAKRVLRRIEIKYGRQKPQFTGYSGNISRSGIMVRALRVFGPGTILQIELKAPGRTLRLQGKVKWARQGNIRLLGTGRVGMGIRWVQTPEDFLAWLEKENRCRVASG